MTELKRRRPSLTLLVSLLPTLLLPLLFLPTPLTRLTPTHAPPSPVTIGIKTYACDATTPALLTGLLASIRLALPTAPVLIANDGPHALSHHPPIAADPYTTELRLPLDVGISAGRNALVAATKTPLFMLLDDDHLLSGDIDLSLLSHPRYDIVGLGVRNLPGIPELEHNRIFLPRYVANITRFRNRVLELCVWDENAGPGVHAMRHPVRVDVLHNAFVARTDVLRTLKWRDELKVNEHMTFFLDARRQHVRVGYLPSVYVHHRPRNESVCYGAKRGRETEFAKFLDYDDQFAWTKGCYKRFPEYVRWHLAQEKRSRAG